MSPMECGRAQFCPRYYSICTWIICLGELKECSTGCLVGDRLINHMLYAGDLVALSPSSAGLQQLLRICSQYGIIMYDIQFDSTKSVVLIARTKEDRKLRIGG